MVSNTNAVGCIRTIRLAEAGHDHNFGTAINDEDHRSAAAAWKQAQTSSAMRIIERDGISSKASSTLAATAIAAAAVS
jgi:hypothetical protein